MTLDRRNQNDQVQGRGNQGTQANRTQAEQTPPLTRSQIVEAAAFNKKLGYSKALWQQIQTKAKSGADGVPGSGTAKAIAAYQKLHSIKPNGKADEGTMKDMGLFKYIGKIPAEFDEMWKNHPHNDGYGGATDTSSEEVRKEEGLPSYLSNTCAIRLSVMFNGMGGNFKISPEKAVKAGIPRKRVFFSKKKKHYYIVSAKEMWNYVDHWMGDGHANFPKSGKYTDDASFQKGWNSDIKKAVSGKKGIVAFKKIFSYSGTGHVDLFDGEKLSDAQNWYPSQRISLWYA